MKRRNRGKGGQRGKVDKKKEEVGKGGKGLITHIFIIRVNKGERRRKKRKG